MLTKRRNSQSPKVFVSFQMTQAKLASLSLSLSLSLALSLMALNLALK